MRASRSSGSDAGRSETPRARVFDSAESEALFAQWRATGDEGARERLILAHRNLVLFVARRFAGGGEGFEDVAQVGMMGLIHALENFDPARGLKFSTFATPTISGEIRNYFRDKTSSVRLPRRVHEHQASIARQVESLTQQLGRSPTYVEIGRALGLEAEEVAEIVEMGSALSDVSSLDAPAPGQGEHGTIAEQLGAPDPDLEAWSEHAELEAALEKLPPRSREVLQLAYFGGYSQAEIARRFRVSQMHISRVQRRALAELRALLDAG